jgi:hypothetical protein
MKEEKLAEVFKEAGIGDEITCPQAFAIAQKHKIPKKAVGEYCNSHRIKIRACQLGCFR